MFSDHLSKMITLPALQLVRVLRTRNSAFYWKHGTEHDGEYFDEQYWLLLRILDTIGC